MLNVLLKATLLMACLAAAKPTPGAPRKRDSPVHCVDDDIDGPKTVGNLYCVGSDGTTLSCDECLGLSGDPPLTTAVGGMCYITTGADGGTLGNSTACPGDPPPTSTPDGSDPKDIAGDIVDAWCDVAGTDGLFGWTTYAVCYSWTFATAGGSEVDEDEAGVKRKPAIIFPGPSVPA